MASQTEISQALQGSGVNVSGLLVKDVGGVTAVYGTVATDDDKRKAEQAIEGKVGKISNHMEVARTPGTIGAGSADRMYVVKSGDTLSKIAKEHYGDANAWKRIQEANADLIRDPDKIQPGWNLRIPM